LRDRIAAGGSGRAAEVTASIGVAYSARPRGVSLDDLLSLADAALYAAKEAGRNQVQTRQMPVGAPISRAG
jgi:diguanylate cyclase (GGDEF)-like protein